MRNIFLTLFFLIVVVFIRTDGYAQPAFNFPGGLDYQNTYNLNQIFDITPDGKMAAVIGMSETPPIGSSQVAIIDTVTGQRLDTQRVQNVGGAISVKFAVLADGIKVLVMSDNNNGNKYLTIFNLAANGLLTQTFHTQLNNNPGVSSQGSNIVYSPVKRTAFVSISGGANRLISVDLDTGAVLHTLTSPIYDNLNLFEDGTRKLIVSGGIDTVIFFDYSNPAQMQELGRVLPPTTSAFFGTHQFSSAFSSDGNHIFTGNGYTRLSAINTATRQVVGSLSSSRYRVRRMKIFENASTRFLVIQGIEDGDNALKGYAVINAQDPANLSVTNEMVVPSSDIFDQRSITITRDGKRLLVGSSGKLSAFAIPDFGPVWQVPLQAFDSAQLTTIGQRDRIFGAWLNKVFTFPNFTNRLSNFDLDGKSDIGTFRPSTGSWQWTRSTDNMPGTLQLGQAGDIPVPADYDGDERTDQAVFRPGSREWLIRDSSTGLDRTVIFGIGSDTPVSADYDGDGKADIAVFKKYPVRWSIIKSSDGQLLNIKGTGGQARPVTGDYDADGKTDFALFRSGTWQIIHSSGLANTIHNLGTRTDIPISGDFDNDGKTDIAIFEPATRTWRIHQTFYGGREVQFGQALDVPVPGDYDGDGKTDIAVFRPSNSTWQILQSTNNATITVQFGVSGDIPLTLQK